MARRRTRRVAYYWERAAGWRVSLAVAEGVCNAVVLSNSNGTRTRSRTAAAAVVVVMVVVVVVVVVVWCGGVEACRCGPRGKDRAQVNADGSLEQSARGKRLVKDALEQ